MHFINFDLFLDLSTSRLNTKDPFNEDNFFFNKGSSTLNKHGGRVEILVKEELEFVPDFSYDEFASELLCIKINPGKDKLYIFSLNNPPSKLLNFNIFEKINRNFKNYVLGGDLNVKTRQIGCKGENENGIILESNINELNIKE
ncbi:hypothetical protein BpHYR1_001206 [Brachionus plicatilis]|uniref:RNA-directed DNA polymerase from mobile element jockey-like n=1 Tax=Brachionus plicatilis TaxID=10195 RepID=A0A3M7PAG3_BRAPC|nr:hypothetical protein BpHYR1_001206 [Brachionus plicatilis]